MSPRPELLPAPAERPGAAAAWRALLRQAAAPAADLSRLPAHPLTDRFGPLLAPRPGRPRVFAHLAQSIDGRIALPDGAAFWISGADDVRHCHRLRALADAVLVGAETVVQDDPRLTVRQCEGPDPLRVILDPRGRVPASAAVCQGGPPTLLLRHSGSEDAGDAEVCIMPRPRFSPVEVLAQLRTRGVRRLFVEGGGVTISRFLAAGCLDRLHLVVAPVVLGAGRPGLDLPLGGCPGDCPRPVHRVERLGDDMLYDLDVEGVAASRGRGL